MNLWIYGDSFSVENNPDSGVEKTWTETIADSLELSIINNAEHGVSNDFIYNTIIKTLKNWSIGDCVIIQLTAPWRVWFFEDLPHLSNFTNCNLNDELDYNQAQAVEQYSKYLFNKASMQTQYFMIQDAIKQLCLENPNVKILVLPGFHPLINLEGTLSTICVNEFENEKVSKDFYTHWDRDPRINHLTEENQNILANRVINFFTTGQLPNLVNGFKIGVITEKNYKDIT